MVKMNRERVLDVARLAVVASVVFAGVPQASADSVKSQLFPNQLNLLSDNSAESQNVDLNGDGFLGLGDTLRGIVEVESIEDFTGGGGANGLGGASGNNELTGVFETEVVDLTIIVDPDQSCGSDPTCGNETLLTGDEFANYVFGPNAAFADTQGEDFGTTVIFREDPANDFSRIQPTQAANEATATGGVKVLTLGFFGDGDEIWAATAAPIDPSLGKAVSVGTGVGVFNFQQSIGFNSLLKFNQVRAGIPLTDGLIDVNASGGITGTLGSNTYYDIFDNVDLVINFIPLPNAGWMGILLLAGSGLSAYLRRRGRGWGQA